MNPDELAAVIRKVFSDLAPEVDIDAVDPNAPLQATLDLDSMDFLNAMIAIHEVTGVDVPEADYGQVTTFEAIERYVRDRIVAA